MLTNLLRKIKDNWQILATLLITWSIFDLYNYYILFGIEIQSYINISEILLLVFPSILNGIISVLFITIFFTVGLRKRKAEPDPKKAQLIKEIDEHNSTLFRFKRTIDILKADFKPFKLKNIFSIFIGCMVIVIETFFWLFIIYFGYKIYMLFTSDSLDFYPTESRLRFGILFLITVFFLLPIFLLIDAYFDKHAHKIFSNFTIANNPIIYFVLGFIFNGVISNRIQYLNITNGQSKKNVSFIHNEKEIRTDSNFVYIGSTQSYIFIRDNKDRTSIVFNKDETKNIKIKN